MTSGTTNGSSGLAFVDCGMSAAVGSLPEGRRRGVAVNGRRIKTIDIHAHCAVPEALALMDAQKAAILGGTAAELHGIAAA